MCIRDSYKIALLNPNSKYHVSLRVSYPNDFDRAMAKAEGCLLYTSDAADDLPCVDTGGRRISKKKKQQSSSDLHRP